MRYIDQVYGAVEIEEPVALALIASPALIRLKDIDQAGFKPLWAKPAVLSSADYSRYGHSVGVYLLLKRYGAPLAEQVAGLIHDVSHSAFSHTIDYVLAGGSESEHSHQDNVFAEKVMASGIPAILEAHGLETAYVLDDDNFPLKEKSLPDLCADRIDYALRGAVIFGEISQTGALRLLERLEARDGRWVFADEAAAAEFAELFQVMNAVHYADLTTAVMFRTVGDYLKRALAQGYIAEADLYTTDPLVLAKIAPHHGFDQELARLFDRMNNKVACVNDPADYEAKVLVKSRVVDPWCLVGGEAKRLSAIRPGWQEVVASESRPKEYFLRFAD